MARKKVIENYFIFSQEVHRKDYHSIIIWVAPEAIPDGKFDKQYKRYSVSYTTSLPMYKFDSDVNIEWICNMEFSWFHSRNLSHLLNIQTLVPQYALEAIQEKVRAFIKMCYYNHVE
jgi:hypothetical protein